jgi:hypothetical protein
MEMSSQDSKKDCCQRTLILKAKAQRLQWKCGKALYELPHICKQYLITINFEIKVSNFNFSSEKQKFYQSSIPSLLLDMLPSIYSKNS